MIDAVRLGDPGIEGIKHLAGPELLGFAFSLASIYLARRIFWFWFPRATNTC